jgi:hypothetical protein
MHGFGDMLHALSQITLVRFKNGLHISLDPLYITCAGRKCHCLVVSEVVGVCYASILE